MASFIDISWPLDAQVLAYPGDPPFSLSPVTSVDTHGYSTQVLTMGSHAGTHVDAPAHFLEGGMTVEEIPLEILCGEALVLDVTAAGFEISASFLSRFDLTGVQRLLLKTSNERFLPHTLTEDFAHLLADAALYLREKTSVRLVGIDYLSIEKTTDGRFPVHRTLLAEDPPIFILEGLDLRQVQSGVYELLCLPLCIRGGDGGPARAALKC